MKQSAKSPQKGAAPGRKGAPSSKSGQKANTAPSPEERRKREEARRAEELRRRREAHEAKLLRRERQKALFGRAFLLALVFVAIYWIWVVVSISSRSDGKEDAMPILVFTKGEKSEDSKFEAEQVYFNNTYYLPVTCLEPYMAITQFGDRSTRSILLCESGEYATFYLNNESAVINGQRVFLKHPAFLKDDVLYLPSEFYKETMNCFTLDDSVALAGKVLTFDPEKTPSFGFKTASSVPLVDPATIPVIPEPTDPADGSAPTL
jgi:hypothetical protein